MSKFESIFDKKKWLQWYILDENHQPVPVDDVLEWGRFFENTDARRVAATRINGLFISTVFLGIDYGWPGAEPILFETMIFQEQENELMTMHRDYQTRYSTWDEALKGHEQIVTMIREGLF